jgi:hypothetical protein
MIFVALAYQGQGKTQTTSSLLLTFSSLFTRSYINRSPDPFAVQTSDGNKKVSLANNIVQRSFIKIPVELADERSRR